MEKTINLNKYITSAICSKCGKEYNDLKTMPNSCECEARIDITLNLASIGNNLTRDQLLSRKRTPLRYKEFFPYLKEEHWIQLGQGFTPLIKSTYFSEKLGIKKLFWKMESLNPTGSFKDRPISLGVSMAKQRGSKATTAASSGNAGAACATYSARAGIESYIFVPESAPESKLRQIASVGATVIRVKAAKEGDSTITMMRDSANEFGWVPVPSFGPFNSWQFEGTKTLGYELAEEFDWKGPDVVIFGTGSCGFCAGTIKGFSEFKELGWIDSVPKPVIVQPENCAPVVKSFKENSNMIQWPGQVHTIAGGLADPWPWDGDIGLKMLKNMNGDAITVTENQIIETQKILAKEEGIFGEASGIANVAALKDLLDKGIIDKDQTIVCPISGSGFKDIDKWILDTSFPVIDPTIDSLRRVLN